MPGLLGPVVVVRRQSCVPPQKPLRLRRCRRKRDGGGGGWECQGDLRVLCIHLGHGGLGNSGLRRPEEARAHPVARPRGQCPNDIIDASDLGPRTQAGPRACPTPSPCTCKSGGQGGSHSSEGLSFPSSSPAPLQLKSRVREERDVEDGGTGCLDKTEGTLQREMQNNQENMPEVTSRAQGTKKESGRNRLNSEKPRRKPIS